MKTLLFLFALSFFNLNNLPSNGFENLNGQWQTSTCMTVSIYGTPMGIMMKNNHSDNWIQYRSMGNSKFRDVRGNVVVFESNKVGSMKNNKGQKTSDIYKLSNQTEPTTKSINESIACSIKQRYPLKVNVPPTRLSGKSFRVQTYHGPATVSSNGTLKADLWIHSNRWEGFHGRAIFIFQDIRGNEIHRVVTPSYGVNAKSDRYESFTAQVSPVVLFKTHKIKGIPFRNYTSPTKQIAENKAVIKQATKELSELGATINGISGSLN